MSVVFYIKEEISCNYESNLFNFFDSKVSSSIDISSSFSSLDESVFPVFTDVNQYISKIISDRKVDDYGVFLDSDNLNKVDLKKFISIYLKAKFVIFVGRDQEYLKNIFKNVSNISYFSRFHIPLQVDFNTNGDKFLSEISSLPDLYEDILNGVVACREIYVLGKGEKVNLNLWINKFSKLNKKIKYYESTHSIYRLLVKNVDFIYQPKSNNLHSLIDNLGEQVDDVIELDFISNEICKKYKKSINNSGKGVINIVCYNPTYLFKDLVDRFTDLGCVHSDFPLANADAYIWMRPQEIWHLEYLSLGKEDREISNAYRRKYEEFIKKEKINIFNIKNRSVAIHHGTCFEPLYQFNYINLVKSLVSVQKVIGVCELDECYGPSAPQANKNNYSFVPIGYDDNLFIEDLIKKELKAPQSKLKIGFVGRAYGTTDLNQLDKSKLAEPKGYRKGGDYLYDISSRLKLLGVEFELHILGQNWEELVYDLEDIGVDVTYYTRDKNIVYTDYPKIYKEMDLLLITARCEGGPVSALEALSLGVHVVSTDVGVVKFLNKHFAENDVVGCDLYTYNNKWNIADISKAIKSILDIYNKEITYENRLDIRNLIKEFTTNNWVNSILSNATSCVLSDGK